MVEIWEGKGLREKDARALVNIMARYPSFLVDVMMSEELGFGPIRDTDSAMAAGLQAAGAFAGAGALPLAAFITHPLALVTDGLSPLSGALGAGAVVCSMVALSSRSRKGQLAAQVNAVVTYALAVALSLAVRGQFLQEQTADSTT